MSGNGVDMRLYELIFWGAEATPLIYCYRVVLNKLCVVDIMVILRFPVVSDRTYYIIGIENHLLGHEMIMAS